VETHFQTSIPKKLTIFIASRPAKQEMLKNSFQGKGTFYLLNTWLLFSFPFTTLIASLTLDVPGLTP